MRLRGLVDQSRQWWADKPVRDAEWALWANVPDLAHLRELTAWFCEGKLSFTPNHAGPRDPETVDIGDALAHANRSGFLTTNSQNGGEHDPAEAAAAGVVVGRQWRSVVEGLADDATAAKLRGLVAGTRLCMQVAPLKLFPQQGTVPGTHQKPDGTPYDGNNIPSWRAVAQWFQGTPGKVLSQVTHLNYVQIVDPKWGPSDLLWERLSTPNWDNPTKPSTTSPARTAPTPSGVSMTSADTYSSLRGRVQGIADRMPERQGLLQQVLAELDQDIAELNQINEDSNQAGIEEAIGLLMQAKDSVEQAIWMVGGAQASTEGAAAGLQ